MQQPAISIITINYNNAQGLQQTIESIIAQSFTDYEYLVIDGGSTDGSKEVIQKYTSHIHYWVSERDGGIYNAMNKGISKANGRFIVFMNSGDTYLQKDVLQRSMQEINSNVADVYYGQIIVDEGAGDRTVIYPRALTLDYQRDMVINHQACFFKRDTLAELGGYQEEYKLAADYAFYLKATLNNKIFAPLLFPIVRYDASGISSKRMDDYRKEMRLVWANIVPDIITQNIDQLIELRQQMRAMQNGRVMKIAGMVKRLIQKMKHGAN